MDPTVKLLLDKITQLTTLFNSMTQNSKKIHELGDAAPNEELYIAVSDGTNTGKTIYEPSEVSKEEFENISNMKLETDIEASNLLLKDSEGNVMASANLSFLNGNNVTLNVNHEEKRLELLDFNEEVISAIDLSELYLEKKQKAILVHTLTKVDISQATITLTLQNAPDVTEFYDLHINGAYVNDDDYIIQENRVIIAKSNIAYDVVEGMKLTFRYRY